MSETRTRNLAGVVGGVAAALLLTLIPREESGGRKYLKVYLDIVGVATVCDGLTRDERGRPFRPGQSFTEAQCSAMLDRELTATAEKVMACTPALKDHPYQTVAAVSLAYNIGTAGYCRSGVDRAFDAGRWRQGCDAVLLWNRAGGRVIKGLADRRRRERAICLTDLPR